MHSVRWFLYQTLLVTLFFLAVGYIGFLYLFHIYGNDLPDITNQTVSTPINNVFIYDRNNTLLREIQRDEVRVYVPLQDISSTVKLATIALEDDEFFAHQGFDTKALLRVFGCIMSSALREIIVNIPECRKTGGSTITQQYVKNTYLERTKSIERKFRELVLAVQLESRYNKEQILELYLNKISYGGNIYGIQKASERYFAKSAKDLTLTEGIILASIPARPEELSPLTGDKQKLKERSLYAMNRMKQLNMLSEQELIQSRTQIETLTSNADFFHPKPKSTIRAPHFADWIPQEIERVLTEKYGKEKAHWYLEKGGLSVKTTLDISLQELGEKIVKESLQKLGGKKYNVSNAALVAQNPQNGEILTMVGSKDFYAQDIDGQVNVAVNLRQPGSSIKPLVYGLALEKGMKANSLILDAPTTFGGSYRPENYTGTFKGQISLRNALAQSLNIPAVKMLEKVTTIEAVNRGQLAGISSWNDQSAEMCGLALALGACETRLIEMVNLYSSIANLGTSLGIQAILSIRDIKGEEIYRKPDIQKKVYQSGIAYILHSILSDNNARAPMFGVKNPLALSREAGAKTGTTNKNYDAWTLGYIKQLTVGVWAGNNTPSAMKYGGIGIAAPIWRDFMEEIMKMPAYSSPEGWTPPDDVIAKKIRIAGKVRTEYHLKEGAEKISAEERVKFYYTVLCRDGRDAKLCGQDQQIAYFRVDYGNIPINERDPLLAWVKEELNLKAPGISQKLVTSLPQARKDDTKNTILHNEAPPQNKAPESPKASPARIDIFFTSPNQTQFLWGEEFFFSGSVASENGISRVETFINGAPLGSNPESSKSVNFGVKIRANNLKIGQNTLTVRAFSADGTSNKSSLLITIYE